MSFVKQVYPLYAKFGLNPFYIPTKKKKLGDSSMADEKEMEIFKDENDDKLTIVEDSVSVKNL